MKKQGKAAKAMRFLFLLPGLARGICGEIQRVRAATLIVVGGFHWPCHLALLRGLYVSSFASIYAVFACSHSCRCRTPSD